MRIAGPLALALLVAALPASAQATSPWTTVAIPGGWATVEAVGLTDDDRAHTLLVLTRLLHANPTGASTQEATLMRRLVESMARPATLPDGLPRAADVPVLFNAEHWSHVLSTRVTAAGLFETLVQDRAAMLLHYGLVAAAPGVQARAVSDRGLLRWIYRNAPGAMAVVGASLGMDGEAIAVPGGAAAYPVWQELTGVSPLQPAEFLRELLARDQGRLAWFFDTLTQLDEERLAAVFGPADRDRVDRVRALYRTFVDADPNWVVEARPFVRVQADASAMVREVEVRNGGIAPPNDAGLWAYVFSRGDLSSAPDVSDIRLTGDAVTPDWLARAITATQLRERRDRFDVVLFAQRVFGRTAQDTASEVAYSLVNFPRYRALLLTLERMGLRDPAHYATLVRAARYADNLSGARRRDAVIAFQGALALATRAKWAGTLDRESTALVVVALGRAVMDAADVPVAVAQWLSASLAPALPRLTNPDALTGRTAYEARILQGVAGALDAPDRAVIEWEGLRYVVDPAAAEFARLHDARSRLDSPGLDAAIAHPRASGLADALLALVYATALGDPSGPAFFSRTVAARHEFGFDSASSQRRAVVPWTVPYEMVGDSGPWRGVGSLLGLDLAMARLTLRRFQEQDMPEAPTIGANEAQVMARTLALLSPFELTNATRDEIVAAIRRGRSRVEEAADNPRQLDALGADAGVSPWTRALIPWMLEHEPAGLATVFARRHLLELGRPAVPQEELDRWGAYAEPTIGCLCTRMPRAEPWERHGGRTETGQMAAQSVDLALRLAEDTAAMELPAVLIPALMAYAVQDQIHEIRARSQDDWPASVRAAERLTRTRVEDYVAALAGTVLQPR